MSKTQSDRLPPPSSGSDGTAGFPRVVRLEIDRWISSRLRPFCFEYDSSLMLRAGWGPGAHYGFERIETGMDISTVAPYLIGVDCETDSVLRFIEDPEGRHIHVYLLTESGRSFALLCDASEEHEAARRIQQRSNENALLLARQKRLIDEMIDVRCELDQRRREAEEDSRRKGEFIATMSHDLKNPLSSVLLNAELIAGRELDDERARAAAEAIKRIVGDQVRIIDNMIDQARSEATGQAINTGTVDIRTLLDEVSLVFAPLAAEKELGFEFGVAEDVTSFVRLDETKLRRILGNLIGNAIKFADAGAVHLAVACDAGQLRFDVEDTGPGIAPEDRQRIFLAFERAGNRRPRPGAGLGLAISRGFAEAMGGSLFLSSSSDRGSRFSLIIPYCPVVSFLAPSPSLDRLALRHDVPLPYEVLLCDDDDDIVGLLELHLSGAGYRVRSVTDPDKVVELVRSSPPDLLVLDINLQGRNGLDIARELREAGFAGAILGLSASNLGRTRRRLLANGFTDFLPKPVSSQLVLKKIETLLLARQSESNPGHCI
ncbi:MAG: hybrid sensor histidine kinase/response regulator [Gammaproteobacteria bacterium]